MSNWIVLREGGGSEGTSGGPNYALPTGATFCGQGIREGEDYCGSTV